MAKPTGTVDDAVARLTADCGPSGITVTRISANEVVLTHAGETAVVTFDPDKGMVAIAGPEVLAKRDINPGDKTTAFNYHGPHDRQDFYPMTLLAGKGVEFSGTSVREPATGRFEPMPASLLGRYIYDRTVLYGWKQQRTLKNSWVIGLGLGMAAFWILVLLGVTIALVWTGHYLILGLVVAGLLWGGFQFYRGQIRGR
ncbi:MAG: hypothetical protein QM728_09145 [Gordonia sp. (in: high G+C Gram-positive bacteria)]|uniref:hypothetical protein n=1 Tax=Gordonia sp. (in: high G+C Gram-positive bacteria) TaxID=84139 RepID=UPI0039E6E925